MNGFSIKKASFLTFLLKIIRKKFSPPLDIKAKKEYNMNVIKNKGVSYGIQDKRMA
jgi:hypothetical protein